MEEKKPYEVMGRDAVFDAIRGPAEEPSAADRAAHRLPGVDQFQAFCLVSDNAGSGSTLAGSLLDAHPRIEMATTVMNRRSGWWRYE